MRVAAIQMNSGSDVAANLQLADRLLAAAAADNCRIVVLPENFALMPEHGRDKTPHAEKRGDGPIQNFLADASRRHGIWIIGGSMPLVSEDSDRVFGACPVYDDDGKEHACDPSYPYHSENVTLSSQHNYQHQHLLLHHQLRAYFQTFSGS